MKKRIYIYKTYISTAIIGEHKIEKIDANPQNGFDTKINARWFLEHYLDGGEPDDSQYIILEVYEKA